MLFLKENISHYFNTNDGKYTDRKCKKRYASCIFKCFPL